MGQPFVGEIRMFAGNFPPAGWKFCDGELMSIAENEVLFWLIGNTYGGDGETTFALPDLRGRLPIHMGSNAYGTYTLGETGGAEDVTITPQQLPVHNHPMVATTRLASRRSPKNAVFASPKDPLYTSPGTTLPLDAQAIAPTGGSQPHTNLQPYLCVNFIISLFGVYPSQT